MSYKGAQHPTSGLMLPSLVLLGLHWFTEEDENENGAEMDDIFGGDWGGPSSPTGGRGQGRQRP